MGLLGRLACRAGLHALGEWTYRTPDNCTQFRKCTRCPHEDPTPRVKHQPLPWKYLAPASSRNCMMIQLCLRCPDVLGTKDEHVYEEEWRYPVPGSCLAVLKCERCEEEKQEVRHIDKSSPWELCNPNCEQERSQCQNCKEMRYREATHNQGIWKYAAPNLCDQVSFCLRCKHKEFRPATESRDHEKWGDWKPIYERNCVWQERECLRCHEKEGQRRPPNHEWTEWEPVSQRRKKRLCRRCGAADWQDVAEEE
jgi:hypothetical protein